MAGNLRDRCGAAALGVACALSAVPFVASVRAAEAPAGAAPTGGAQAESGSAVRVITVETQDPCAQKQQRQAAVGNAVGGALLGGAIGAGMEALRVAIENANRKQGEKKEKGNYAVAAGAGAVLGGVIGFRRGLDSARRQCELYVIAQQRALDAKFEQIALLPVRDLATIDPLPVPEGAPAAEPAAGEAHRKKPAPKQPKPTKKPKAEYDEKDLVYATVSSFPDANTFAVGSATLRPEAKAHFVVLAQQFSPTGQEKSARETYRAASEQYRQKVTEEQEIGNLREQWSKLRIVLIGHTDDTGDSLANAQLSEARARAVAEIFREQGVPASQLYYQGAGSSLPVADNRTEQGRAANRRVEVLELPAGADVAQYLSLRRANPALNRPLPPPMLTKAVPDAAPAFETPPANPAVTRPPTATPPASKPGTPPTAAGGWEIPSTPPAKKPAPVAKPAPAKQTPRPANAQVPRKSAEPPAWTIDFGGTPVDAGAKPVASLIGAPRPKRGGWGFISTAYASEATFLDTPCTQDSPTQNVGLPVKQLAGDQPVRRTNEYLPGLYDTAWMGDVNGHAVAMMHVAVLRDGNEPVADPEVLVYRDYDPAAARTADVRLRGTVKVYEGTGALLYRVFAQGSRLRCMDVVLPYNGGFAATAGALYYEDGNVLLTANYKPSMVR